MRPISLLPALLPFASANIFTIAEIDSTVVVTETRTFTVCPMTKANLCGPDVEDKLTDFPWPTGGNLNSTTTPKTTSATSTGYSTSGYHNGTVTTTSSQVGPTGTGSTSTTTSIKKPGATGIAQPDCNEAGDRSRWCGKTIDDDTFEHYETGETKKFTFTITNTTLDFDGVMRETFAINGQAPGPAIEVNWGDWVEIQVTNLLQDNATSIHWHGIRQIATNDQDGVPGVSECGIAPGTARTYRWHASTYGTGWYHSHAYAQYGAGIRGPIIVHGPATADYDVDMGHVMIDDLFEDTIFRMAWRASHTGPVNTTNYLLNGKNKSPDMTRGEHQRWVVQPGKKHRFRIINSSAAAAYAVHFDGHKMKVIGADFTPIVPYETDYLYIHSGQRYDVIVEADQPSGAYYLRAVTQTGCPSRNFNNGLGNANGIFEYADAEVDATPVIDIGDAVPADFTSCRDEPLASLVPHIQHSAGSAQEFSSTVKKMSGGNGAVVNYPGHGRVIHWWLDNKIMNANYTQPTLKTLATMPELAYNSSIYSNAYVLNQPNTWNYFVIQNNFPASHPMHLHGHDFSLLGQGAGIFTDDMVGTLNFKNPIRRDTALLFGTPGAISGYTVIGFQTDNPGAWLMHCHIAWHAEGGMALQWIERPDEIDAAGYVNKPEFQQSCKSVDTYFAEGPHRQKHEFESGLKKKAIGDYHGFHAHAHVRH